MISPLDPAAANQAQGGMSKSGPSFTCTSCGAVHKKWSGRCDACGAWNSIVEEAPLSAGPASKSLGTARGRRIDLTTLQTEEAPPPRASSGIAELDRVLGGGLVPASAILVGGDPGIGKSTLLLQAAASFARKGLKCLYISGEESEQQIKLRANRLTMNKNNHLNLLSISNTDAIVNVIDETKPKLVIIDSIQTMESENLTGLSGSVGQVRYAAMEFIRVAKRLSISVIIVGHVTKEGMVAGPMVLSHMVDTVLFLEGEKFTGVRILRSLKNRFGPVDEVGVFSMEGDGMTEVKNPESLFLSTSQEPAPGSVLTATLEGRRAFLVEIQALAIYSKLPMPRRVASGVDSRRLELLLAVLQKHGHLPIDTMDIYVNVAGGMKLSDPAADLGICLAIFSSLKGIPVNKTVGIAEVGLLGELRAVPDLAKRSKEAKKLGYTNIIDTTKFKTLNQVLGKFT